jgi:hypothetical protein
MTVRPKNGDWLERVTDVNTRKPLNRFSPSDEREVCLKRFDRSQETLLPAAASVYVDSVRIGGHRIAPAEDVCDGLIATPGVLGSTACYPEIAIECNRAELRNVAIGNGRLQAAAHDAHVEQRA